MDDRPTSPSLDENNDSSDEERPSSDEFQSSSFPEAPSTQIQPIPTATTSLSSYVSPSRNPHNYDESRKIFSFNGAKELIQRWMMQSNRPLSQLEKLDFELSFRILKKLDFLELCRVSMTSRILRVLAR